MRKTIRAFTLIELLTVLAIIAILVALLFPAIQTAIRKGEVTKAQVAVTGLATAFRAYYTEYGKWPAGLNNSGQAVNTNAFSNSRNIVFYEFSSKDIDASGNLLDPWKNPYQCAVDTAYQNSINNPIPSATPPTISAGVIVWSPGPDGVLGTKDDVTSW